MESSAWTNEKHKRFLNSMEASFVRTMFDNNNNINHKFNNNNNNTRLDRYLPDSSDSTLDLKSQRIKLNHNITSPTDIFVRRVDGNIRPGHRTRRPHLHSQDQVVPQFENRTEDKYHRDSTN